MTTKVNYQFELEWHIGEEPKGGYGSYLILLKDGYISDADEYDSGYIPDEDEYDLDYKGFSCWGFEDSFFTNSMKFMPGLTILSGKIAFL